MRNAAGPLVRFEEGDDHFAPAADLTLEPARGVNQPDAWTPIGIASLRDYGRAIL
jgi:hypothetical protein